MRVILLEAEFRPIFRLFNTEVVAHKVVIVILKDRYGVNISCKYIVNYTERIIFFF